MSLLRLPLTSLFSFSITYLEIWQTPGVLQIVIPPQLPQFLFSATILCLRSLHTPTQLSFLPLFLVVFFLCTITLPTFYPHLLQHRYTGCASTWSKSLTQCFPSRQFSLPEHFAPSLQPFIFSSLRVASFLLWLTLVLPADLLPSTSHKSISPSLHTSHSSCDSHHSCPICFSLPQPPKVPLLPPLEVRSHLKGVTIHPCSPLGETTLNMVERFAWQALGAFHRGWDGWRERRESWRRKCWFELFMAGP